MRGPLFNDPGPPPAPSGSPCPELWEFEGEGYYKKCLNCIGEMVQRNGINLVIECN